jgi:hypothetical protein
MGISLNGLTPAGTYPGLIKTGDNTAIDGTPKALSDGNGNNLPMEVSTTGVNFTNNLTQGGTALQPVLVSGTNIKTINGASLLGSGNIPVVTSPSGVSGAIQFSNGSAFASDASNLFWDDTNNRLGIGTNAPIKTLEIATPNLIGQFASLRLNSQYYNFYDIINDGNLIFSRGGVEQFRYNQNGNFSINETNPTSKFQVKGSGSTSATTSLLVQNSSGFNAIQVFDDLKVNINSLTFGGNNGYIGINNNPSIDSALRAVRTDAGSSPLSISTGEVGIGDLTTYPSAIFVVSSTTRGFLPPRMTTTQKNAIATPAAGLVLYDSTTNKLQCYNGSTWNDLF